MSATTTPASEGAMTERSAMPSWEAVETAAEHSAWYRVARKRDYLSSEVRPVLVSMTAGRGVVATRPDHALRLIRRREGRG